MLLRHTSQKVDLLKKVPLFSNLSQRHLREIGKHADQVQVEKGRILVQQGKAGWEFIFIAEGKARVEKDGKVIRQLSGGDFFGEISLIDGEPRTATVVAETGMTILVVNKTSFDHLLETIPGLQKKILVSLCQYLRRAEKAGNHSLNQRSA
jgi:CRP-like cAMP-binding protein